MRPRTRLIVLLCVPLLAGCEMLYDLLDIPDPQARAAAAEAEGRAIGSGCRHSGRALEDCYVMNPQASKAAIFTGWRQMNDYMTENNLQEVPPRSERQHAPVQQGPISPMTDPAAQPPITRP